MSAAVVAALTPPGAARFVFRAGGRRSPPPARVHACSRRRGRAAKANRLAAARARAAPRRAARRTASDAEMSNGPLPPDWEATADPSSGNTYYYNTKTNAVSWERPRAAL